MPKNCNSMTEWWVSASLRLPPDFTQEFNEFLLGGSGIQTSEPWRTSSQRPANLVMSTKIEPWNRAVILAHPMTIQFFRMGALSTFPLLCPGGMQLGWLSCLSKTHVQPVFTIWVDPRNQEDQWQDITLTPSMAICQLIPSGKLTWLWKDPQNRKILPGNHRFSYEDHGIFL